MKVVGYATPGQLEILNSLPSAHPGCGYMTGIKVSAAPDSRYSVPLAVALEPLEGVSLTDGDGWWNDDGNIYTQPIDVGPWGARIEVHGHSIDEARMLAFRVLEGLT